MALAFTRCIHLSKAEIELLFARLATVACDWLDGDLVIEMEAIPPLTTRITIATELGEEMREKVFPTFDLGAPLDELARAVRRIPQMIEPLCVEIAPDRMILRASERVRSSAIPPEIGIDDALSSAIAPPSRRSP